MTPKQKQRNLSYVDSEVLSKEYRKAFKSAAYAMGIAIGLLILRPMIFEIGSPEQHAKFMGLFGTMAMLMFLYSAAIAVTFFFFRSNLKPVLFLLNFFVAPSILIWAFMEGNSILTQ